MHIFPTRDLHLLLAAGLNDEMHLGFFEDRTALPGSPWRDLSTESGVSISALMAAVSVGAPVASVRGRTDPTAPEDSPTGAPGGATMGQRAALKRRKPGLRAAAPGQAERRAE